MAGNTHSSLETDGARRGAPPVTAPFRAAAHVPVRGVERRRVIGAQDPFRFVDRLLIHALGQLDVPLVAVQVPLVGQSRHVVGVIGAACTSDVVGVLIGQRIGLRELAAFAEQAAELIDRPKRVRVIRLEHSAAVVQVQSEHLLGLVQLLDMPEQQSQPFGRIERDLVVAPQDPPARRQVASNERVAFGDPPRLVKQGGQQVDGAKGVWTFLAGNPSEQVDRGAQVCFRLVVLGQREVSPADRLADRGLDLRLPVEPAAELGSARSSSSTTVRLRRAVETRARPGRAVSWSRAR